MGTRTYIISTTNCIIVKLTGCNPRRCSILWCCLEWTADVSKTRWQIPAGIPKTQPELLRGSTILLLNSWWFFFKMLYKKLLFFYLMFLMPTHLTSNVDLHKDLLFGGSRLSEISWELCCRNRKVLWFAPQKWNYKQNQLKPPENRQ